MTRTLHCTLLLLVVMVSVSWAQDEPPGPDHPGDASPAPTTHPTPTPATQGPTTSPPIPPAQPQPEQQQPEQQPERQPEEPPQEVQEPPQEVQQQQPPGPPQTAPQFVVQQQARPPPPPPPLPMQASSPSKILDNSLSDLSKEVLELQQTVQRYQDEQLAMKATLLGMIEANTQLVQLVQSNLGELHTVNQQQQDSMIVLDDTMELLKTDMSSMKAQQEIMDEKINAHMAGQQQTNQEMEGHIHQHETTIQELLIHEQHQMLVEECTDLRNRGVVESGVNTIFVNGNASRPRDVYCDMDTGDGGWTVIQRRKDGSVDFERTWQEYADGFGDLEGEFWLGNDVIANLTQRPFVLRIDMGDNTGARRWVQYRDFVMEPAENKYKITARDYTGNAGNSLIGWHDGVPFSTIDQDNDFTQMNCADRFSGAWWYNICHVSNLNGQYHVNGRCEMGMGINWFSWRGYYRSLTFTEMKIRPLNFHVHTS